MIRVPVYSLAFGAIGLLIGLVTGNQALGMFLLGAGSLIGYVVWLRARLSAIRNGKAFHLGSALNVVFCTTIAVGIGIAGVIAGPFGDIGDNASIFWLVMLLINALALWLHWKSAVRAGTLQWFPTGREIGVEILRTVTAEDLGVAALKAVAETGRDALKEVRHMGQHPKNGAPTGREE